MRTVLVGPDMTCPERNIHFVIYFKEIVTGDKFVVLNSVRIRQVQQSNVIVQVRFLLKCFPDMLVTRLADQEYQLNTVS